MLFSTQPREHYVNAPVHEVICQLRFPTILSIDSTEPAEFQEMIRDQFPQYVRRQDAMPPRISGLGTPNPQIQQVPPTANYNFLTSDGKTKINLTRDFISLSTLAYPGWEEFAHMLDKALAAFIKLYQPSNFQRVGLRYMNIISRSKLGLDGSKWADLIAPAYTAVLHEEDVREENVLNSASDLLLQLDNSCRAKIHAGPGRLKQPNPNLPQDQEIKYIFDMDLSMSETVSCQLAAPALEMLHGHANRIFQGAITETLRDAMLEG